MVLRPQELQYDYMLFFLETFCLAVVSTLFLFFRLLRLLFLVIEHTVTVALEIGIGYLAAEFKTGAFYVLAFSHTAGAVAAFGFKTLLHRPDDLLVLIQSDLHTPRTVR